MHESMTIFLSNKKKFVRLKLTIKGLRQRRSWHDNSGRDQPSFRACKKVQTSPYSWNDRSCHGC